MLRSEENEILTKVGPGTPMGDLLRRYWHPIAGLVELKDEPTKEIKLLGEELVLYKDARGRLGLLGLHCPHRKASLAYGIPEQEGLRCCYHGWLFDQTGRCLEQPAETSETTFAAHVKHTAYPVQELGGLIFAYLGPEPAPLIPRYDAFVREGGVRDIGVTLALPCNWLQCMENSVDPVHTEWLHGHYFNYVKQRQGKSIARGRRHHIKIGFDVFEHGIIKRRMLEGDTETSDRWKVGHALVFPYSLRSGTASNQHFQIRVPIDDDNTRIFWYTHYNFEGLQIPKQQEIPVYEVPFKDSNGKYAVHFREGQDMMAWVTQGSITDRTTERLASSDEGVALYRKVLVDQIDKVRNGQDPLGVIRDAEKNKVIELPQESTRLHKDGTDSRLIQMDSEPIGDSWRQYSPLADTLTKSFNRLKSQLQEEIKHRSSHAIHGQAP